MSQPYDALVPELRDDPLSRGYATMTRDQVIASLSAANRPGPIQMRTPQEVYDALSVPEIAAIETAALDDQKARENQAALAWLGYCAVATSLDLNVGARGRVLRDGLVSVGIVSAASRTAVLVAAVTPISRGDELNMGVCAPGNVHSAWEMIHGNV